MSGGQPSEFHIMMNLNDLSSSEMSLHFPRNNKQNRSQNDQLKIPLK